MPYRRTITNPKYLKRYLKISLPKKFKADYNGSMDLERAKEFHGHLGPFLVLGLRLGEKALSKLGGEKYFGLKATVFSPIEPPERCMVDGIQLSTGCTFGKGNIELIPSRRLALFLHREDKGVRVEVREEALQTIMRALKEEGEHQAAHTVLNLPDEELFSEE